MAERWVEVDDPGVLSLLQDTGRPGHAHLGVGRSGAADPASYALANRLVGNPAGAACVESALGGLSLRFGFAGLVAVTGADLGIRHGSRAHAVNTSFYVRPGDRVRLGRPRSGLRSYLAVRGGFLGTPVLGSLSWDTMAALGTPPLTAGTRLQVGHSPEPVPPTSLAPVPGTHAGPITLPLVLGPRDDWFAAEAIAALAGSDFTVTADADRVGLRLDGPPLPRLRTEELESEGVALGSLQVPPDGRATLFLADHPVTGGYPVIGVVPSRALAPAGQATPGQVLRFRVVDACA